MNSQVLNEDLMISPEYIYSISHVKREKTFRSITLDRRTVSLVRSIDNYRRLSKIIIDYVNFFFSADGYDEYAFKRFKEKLTKLYGSPSFFTTSVSIEAISKLKEVKGRFGLRSLADAFDLVVYHYVMKKYCDVYLRKEEMAICK